MSEKFQFLKSVRFWKLVIIAVVGVLFQEGVISQTMVEAITTVLIGDIAINTVDRFSKK